MRLVLTIVAARDYEIEQLDMVTMFLGGKIAEEIHNSLPEGILGGICNARLIKVLYGLKQSPRCWMVTIIESIAEGLRFVCSHCNPCVYIRLDGTFIVIYVDDLLIIGSNRRMHAIRHRLAERFDVTVLGEVKHFLGMVVTAQRKRHRCIIALCYVRIRSRT